MAIDYNKIKTVIVQWGNKVVSLFKDKLAFTTNLKNNITTSYDNNTTSHKISMPYYAIYVDAGRGPGKQPPLQKIKDWCSYKRIDERYAFPIARKIGQEGLPSHPFLYIYLEELPSLIEELQKVLKKEIILNIPE
jgi:phage gpG-like protein